MAGKSNSEQIKQALRTLEQSRREISAEAQWLRWKLDPRLAAHRMVDNHTTGLLVTTFVTGLIGAWLLFRKRRQPSHRAPRIEKVRDEAKQMLNGKEAKRGLIGTLFAAAVPLAFKLATSKPVMERVAGQLKEHLARRMRTPVS